VQHDDGEIVRANLTEDAASRVGATERRSDVSDEHGVPESRHPGTRSAAGSLEANPV
jgi:hypothetical protein